MMLENSEKPAAEDTAGGNTSEPDDDSSSSAEEIEPKLKYERLCNNVQSILQKDAVSCVTFNSKIICIGTRWGLVYVFDHQGNSIHIEHLRSHTVAVNQISLDLVGEFIATCSDDGKAYVYGLYTTDHQLQFNFGRSIRSVGIDPLYYKLGVHRRFVTGDDRLLLHEKNYFISGLRTTVLLESVGTVQNIKWYGRFIACACRDSVRLYDIEERKTVGFIPWDRPGDNLMLEQYPCCFTWKNSTTLLIGWLNTFRICRIEKRHSIIKESPSFMVNVVSTLRVDYFICGICPFDVNQLVILAYMKERDANGAALPPRMYVFQADDSKHVEIYSDTLSLRSYRDYACNDYHLECLLDENRFIIACPKDVIVANIYDDDDRIEWLVSHDRFDEALELVTTKQRLLQRNTLLAVGKKYVDHLLKCQDYLRAGEICARVLGTDKNLWENEVFKFARAGQLRAISQHLPVNKPHKLDPHIYEMVLYEYLKREPDQFLKIVKQWSPELYNVKAVLHAALEHVLKNPNISENILESVAILYSHDHQHEKAIRVYSSIKHKGVFDLIRKYKLNKTLGDQIRELMELDAQQAISVFLGNERLDERLDPDLVVSKLQHNQYYLYLYLDALDTDMKNEGRKYHPQLVKLYANFSPNKLLPLLRRSHNYPIHEALAICKERNLYTETVYLLDRMGNTKEALQLLISKIGDMEQAIIFCKEHNDMDLWEELVELSLSKPDFIKYLLQKIGTYVDPRVLICRLDKDVEIPGLKNSVVKMLQDRSLQISIKEGCKNIVVSDSYNLHKSFVGMQQCGYSVDDDLVCSVCNQKVLIKDNRNNVLLFYCRHTFHEECLPSLGDAEKCIICSSQHGGTVM